MFYGLVVVLYCVVLCVYGRGCFSLWVSCEYVLWVLVVWLLARNSWLLGLLVGCGLWLFVGLLIVLFRALIGCCLCVYVMCMFIIAVISCCCLFDFGDLCGCVGLIVWVWVWL